MRKETCYFCFAPFIDIAGELLSFSNRDVLALDGATLMS